MLTSDILYLGILTSHSIRAGSSAWYERSIRNREVAGSNPAQSITTNAKGFDQI